MKTTILFYAIATMIGSVANADYKLAKSGAEVVCYADDNQSWELNAARTTIKYTVEGESLGARKISLSRLETDHKNFVSYPTTEGTLTFSDTGDIFKLAGADEVTPVRCRQKTNAGLCGRDIFTSEVQERFNNNCNDRTEVEDAEEIFDGVINALVKQCPNLPEQDKRAFIRALIAKKRACYGA